MLTEAKTRWKGEPTEGDGCGIGMVLSDRRDVLTLALGASQCGSRGGSSGQGVGDGSRGRGGVRNLLWRGLAGGLSHSSHFV